MEIPTVATPSAIHEEFGVYFGVISCVLNVSLGHIMGKMSVTGLSFTF